MFPVRTAVAVEVEVEGEEQDGYAERAEQRVAVAAANVCAARGKAVVADLNGCSLPVFLYGLLAVAPQHAG
jgi:hypothetical protein